MVGAAPGDSLHATAAVTAVGIRAEKHVRTAGGIIAAPRREAAPRQEEGAGCAVLMCLSRAEYTHQLQCLHGLP